MKMHFSTILMNIFRESLTKDAQRNEIIEFNLFSFLGKIEIV